MNIRLPLALAAACLLTACGNKGPLVLPQKPVPVETATPAAQPATPTPSTETPQSQPAPQPASEPAQEPSATPAPKP